MRLKGKVDYKKILFILLVLALIIRLAGINQFFETDEVVWARAVKEGNLMEVKIPSSLLSLWAIIPFIKIFGVHTWSIRLPFLIAGMFTILYTFLLGKLLFGKKSALWATAIMSFSAWHVLASLQATYEGSFLTLFFVMSIYYYLKYEIKQKNISLVFAGISFGLATLSKLTAVLLLPILLIYSITKTRDILLSTRRMIVLSLIGFVTFLIFPIVSIITKSPAFIVSLYYLLFFPSLLTTNITNISLLIIQFLYAIIWAGPLFIGLPLIRLSERKKTNNRKFLVLTIWIIFMIFFYVFIIKDNFRPMERYMMIIIPALSIICGEVLSKIRWDKKLKTITAISFPVSFSLMLLMSKINIRFLPFYPKTAFLKEAIMMRWNFFVPFTGSSGPVGFYIKFSIIALSFIFAGVFLIWSILTKIKGKKLLSRKLLVIFVAISFAFNIFVLQEYLIGTTSPDINEISWEIIEYANENQLKKPLFIFRNKGVPFYLEKRYTKKQEDEFNFNYFEITDYSPDKFYPVWLNYTDNYYDYDDIYFMNFDFKHNQTLYLAEKYIDLKKSQDTIINSTILFIDFPYVDKKSELWTELQTCELKKEFISNGYKTGYIFECG